jgi:hypothetical protein
MAMSEVQPDAPIVEEPVIVENDAANDTAAPADVEALAKEMGWDPNFKGENARSAVDWIRSTGANNRNLRREMKEMKSSIDRIAQTADRQVKREVEARAAAIQAEFEEAVANKDTAAAAKAAKEMTALRDEGMAPVANVEQTFARENPWYGTNRAATALAVALSAEEAQNGNHDPAAQLAAVREGVKKRFPELFGDTQEPKPPPALGDPGNRTVAKSRAKTFADMPDIARAAAERFYEAAKNRGTAPDRAKFNEQYAKDYFNEQAA